MVVNLLISKSHGRFLYSLSPFNFQIILVFTTRSTVSEVGFGYVPSLYKYINQGICLAKGLFFLNLPFFLPFIFNIIFLYYLLEMLLTFPPFCFNLQVLIFNKLLINILQVVSIFFFFFFLFFFFFVFYFFFFLLFFSFYLFYFLGIYFKVYHL